MKASVKLLLAGAVLVGAFVVLGQAAGQVSHRHGMAEASAGLLVHQEAAVTGAQLAPQPQPSSSTGSSRHLSWLHRVFRVHRVVRWVFHPLRLPWWMRG